MMYGTKYNVHYLEHGKGIYRKKILFYFLRTMFDNEKDVNYGMYSFSLFTCPSPSPPHAAVPVVQGGRTGVQAGHPNFPALAPIPQPAWIGIHRLHPSGQLL